MLTETGDLVVDPFCGSCATGEAAERTRREWICCDMVEDYLKGALGRFQRPKLEKYSVSKAGKSTGDDSYRAFKPGLLWNGVEDDAPLPPDGGAKRTLPTKHERTAKSVSYLPKQPSPQMALLDKPQPARRKTSSGRRHA
jgi:site-specific DNA-methyltransferase (cytosine-N4-specific)